MRTFVKILSVVLLSLCAASLPAQPPKNVYIDARIGSDSANGLTRDTAKQTFSGSYSITSAGDTVVLVNGSLFREQYNPPADNIIIKTEGDRELAEIRGSDIAPASWTQTDAVNYPDVWQITWTRAQSVPTTGSEYLGLWADRVRPRYATSVADLQTNGGWFCNDLTNANHAPSTVYVKSTSNPNSSGVVYEITKRQHCILDNDEQGAAHANLQVASPLKLGGSVGHYGAWSKGTGSADGVWVDDCGIHHFVGKAGMTRGLITTNYSPQVAPSLYVGYSSSGTGKTFTFDECIGLLPPGSGRINGGGFYAHGGTTPDGLTLRRCMIRGTDGCSSDVVKMIVEDCYVQDAWGRGFGLTCQGDSIIRRCVYQDTTATPNSAGVTGIQFSNNAYSTRNLLCENCVSYVEAGNAYRNTSVTGTAVLRNCVFGGTITGSTTPVYQGDVKLNNCILFGRGRTLDGITTYRTGSDFNIFWWAEAGSSQAVLFSNGTLYSGLAAWQTATGCDANSVTVSNADNTFGNPDALFLGVAEGKNNGPKDGDYRINPKAKVKNGAGTVLIGTFADGVTPITKAGPQEHYDFNARAILSGPPRRSPMLPVTSLEVDKWIRNPANWQYYSLGL